jgi:hypothetical protein
VKGKWWLWMLAGSASVVGAVAVINRRDNIRYVRMREM